MATNLNQAQEVVWCKYCNPQKGAEYYCHSCGDPLCCDCKKSHSDDRYFIGHKIVSIDDRLPSLEPCREHPEFIYELACRTCKIPICHECKIQFHLHHKTMSLAKLLDETKKALTKEITEMKTNIKATIDNLIQQASFERDKVYQEIEVDMKKQATMFKTKVDEIYKSQLESVREMKRNDHSAIDKYKMALMRMRHDLNKDVNSSEKVLETFNPTDMIFFRKYHSNVSKFRRIENTFRVMFPSFTKGHLQDAKISDIFGSVTPSSIDCSLNVRQPETEKEFPRPKTCVNMRRRPIIPRPNSVFSYENYNIERPNIDQNFPKLIGELLTPYRYIFHITHYQINKIFFSGCDPKTITFLDLSKGGLTITIPTGLEEVSGLTVSFNGDLYYSDPHKCSVVRVFGEHYSGKKEMFKTRHEPWGLHCTRSGDILVCLIPSPSYEKSEENYSMVVKYTWTGREKLRVFWDQKTGETLFQSPKFVCENVNDDICVSDIGKQMLIVVDESGHFRFSYSGNKQYGNLLRKSYVEFIPNGIDSDMLGNIFIADTKNNNIHQLNKDGEFLGIIISSVDSLIRPWSIRADGHGRLWVIDRNPFPSEISTRPRVLIYKRSDFNIETTVHTRLVLPIKAPKGFNFTSD